MINVKNLGGRKFLLCVLITFFTFLLVLINRLQADEYLKIITGVLALYTGLNVYQKVKTKSTID